ncbi:MAG: glycosyltransferase, partial [Actinobacteria bacterium]|nr:glycosyltransferase [Actinomycetota bacterium]
MKRKKILVASANHWTSSFQVGTHHLARGFVEAGWDVAFISAPISPLHLLGGINQELCERFAIYRSSGYYDRGGHLWTYVPAALLAPHNKPLLRTRWVHWHWASLTWPNVVKKVIRAGFGEVDLLYFDSIHQLFWLNYIAHKKSLLRVADNNAGFERSTPAARELERELVQSVDAVIYTAEQLKEYVESMKPKRMLHVPNGVNFKHFANGPRSLPSEYNDIPKPIAIYVGAIDVWFDYELVNQAAQELPEVSFVLIGS